MANTFASVATDPLRNFRFFVQIHHPQIPAFGKMGFMSVSGLNMSTEVIPYREGGMNTTTQKMPGQTDFAPITLSRGLILGDNAMMTWMRQMFTVIQGTGTQAPGQEFRQTMDIRVLAYPVTVAVSEAPTKAMFRVYNAWPTSVAFSDLDAGANAIVVQQMTLAHEGFDVQIANSAGTESVTF